MWGGVNIPVCFIMRVPHSNNLLAFLVPKDETRHFLQRGEKFKLCDSSPPHQSLAFNAPCPNLYMHASTTIKIILGVSPFCLAADEKFPTLASSPHLKIHFQGLTAE